MSIWRLFVVRFSRAAFRMSFVSCCAISCYFTTIWGAADFTLSAHGQSSNRMLALPRELFLRTTSASARCLVPSYQTVRNAGAIPSCCSHNLESQWGSRPNEGLTPELGQTAKLASAIWKKGAGVMSTLRCEPDGSQHGYQPGSRPPTVRVGWQVKAGIREGRLAGPKDKHVFRIAEGPNRKRSADCQPADTSCAMKTRFTEKQGSTWLSSTTTRK
jgi:hypothetical protein